MDSVIFQIISLGITLLMMGFNGAMFLIVKFNDLKHVEIALKELKEDSKSVKDSLSNLGERISTIEGICTAKCKKTRRTK